MLLIEGFQDICSYCSGYRYSNRFCVESTEQERHAKGRRPSPRVDEQFSLIELTQIHDKIDANSRTTHAEITKLNDKMDANFQTVHDKMDANFQTVHDKMDANFQTVHDKMDVKFSHSLCRHP